jgi:hypothetical protein
MTTPRKHNPARKDSTRNERQARRRKLEKQWLKDHGFTSWESLHTKLMNNEIALNTAKAFDGRISGGAFIYENGEIKSKDGKVILK